MNKQQVNTNDETNDPFTQLFEWAADKRPPSNRKDAHMLQDDAWKAYEVDTSHWYDSVEGARKSHPSIHDSRIWTVHEADDHQYWSSGTTGFVNRMGYYVAAKPVPSNLRIVTSSQCVYCDREECICVRCPACNQTGDYCQCDD